jgi:hypothetical protein
MTAAPTPSSLIPSGIMPSRGTIYLLTILNTYENAKKPGFQIDLLLS